MLTWKTSICRSTFPRRRCSPGYVFALHPNPTGQATETIQLDYAQRPFGSAADRSLPPPLFLPSSLLQLHGMRDGNINLDNFFSSFPGYVTYLLARGRKEGGRTKGVGQAGVRELGRE